MVGNIMGVMHLSSKNFFTCLMQWSHGVVDLMTVASISHDYGPALVDLAAID